MLVLEALDRTQHVIYLIESRASDLANEDRLAKIVAQMFRKQGSVVETSFKRSHSSDLRIIIKALQEGDSYLEAIEKLVKSKYLLGIDTINKKMQLGLSFDLKHPLAVKYFKNYGTNLLKELNETTKEKIKSIVDNGLELGHSYDRIAKTIKETFVDYAKLPKRGPKHIRSRAQLIAVTELGNAYQQGNLDAVRAAMSTGLQFQKKWSTTGDARVSDGCSENGRANWIDVDAEFPSGHDRPLRFPGCRCALLLRRKTQ